jgi:hypothetical protein
MSWNEFKHKKQRCHCGLEVVPTHMTRHATGLWHERYKDIIALRKRGLTYAEIARQIRSSRAYVRLMFKKVRLLDLNDGHFTD